MNVKERWIKIKNKVKSKVKIDVWKEGPSSRSSLEASGRKALIRSERRFWLWFCERTYTFRVLVKHNPSFALDTIALTRYFNLREKTSKECYDEPIIFAIFYPIQAHINYWGFLQSTCSLSLSLIISLNVRIVKSNVAIA